VLVPLKALPAAKSRLAAAPNPATRSPAGHAELVTAIRADTLAAVRAAAGVARVVVVTDQPGGEFDADEVIVQQAPGLNGGLREAALQAAQRWPGDGVAAVVGDLPALLPADLDAALTIAAEHDHSFVPDAPATGTTLLAASAGMILVPQFGAGSADRHRLTSHEIAAGPSLRADVDTVEDLAAAQALGIGPRTATILGAATNPEP
jgi:2-phospho-L-lactate guanylyltransferase